MEINNTYDNSKILISDLESEKDSDNNIEMWIILNIIKEKYMI